MCEREDLDEKRDKARMCPPSTIWNRAKLLYYLSQNATGLICVVLTTGRAPTLIAFWICDFMLPRPGVSAH
jgi:hypothetical protein